MDDKSSLVKALAGSDTVFAVTNYWETGSKEREVQQGKNIVDGAKVGLLLASSASSQACH